MTLPPGMAPLPPPIEMLRVRRTQPGIAWVTLRLPGVLLNGIRADRDMSGSVRLTYPDRIGRDGRVWPLVTLQPGVRENVEAAVARYWNEAESSVVTQRFPPDVGAGG